jgi:trehalose 6-phosphate synthase/phosphatase
VGGLATGLASFYQERQGLWIGWPGVPKEVPGKQEIQEKLAKALCHPVFLPQCDVKDYYHGFCNKTIWPLFHYFTQYPVYDQGLWEAYRRVNQAFCRVVIEAAEPGDTIWVHDYHLMLLPQLIREELPEATIGFFLHIPFPSSEVFRLLPWRKEIVAGILGADLVGFHTYDYVRHFLTSVRYLLGYESTLGHIATPNRVVKVDAFPMGIDYEKFAGSREDPKVQQEISEIRRQVGDRKMILSIDRLDYTKGIPERLEAFDLFLDEHPEYKEKIVLILVVVPSRTGVERYRQLARRLDGLVGKINGRHGTIGWVPVWYMFRSLPFHTLVALYNAADVALITPLRDGMNLIAKEFVASSERGVLILSEMAGAAKELGEAITVNPNDREEIAQALARALVSTEQITHNRRMRERLRRYDVRKWADDFLQGLSGVKEVQGTLAAREVTPKTCREFTQSYHKQKKRLFLLDYDGTLVPLAQKPAEAVPDKALVELLTALAKEAGNEVVIVSGRVKEQLERWFGRLDLGLVAEHGVWIRERGGEWETIEPLEGHWKAEVRPILEFYVDRTPGSALEEKDFSLAWHYRRVDPELAVVRARELADTLQGLTANFNLGVLWGDKVIEIKSGAVNKGRAALRWISKADWDFIMAIGDDRTDEDVFACLPSFAYSIRVGMNPSRARFNLRSPLAVRSLLEELVRSPREGEPGP